MRFQGQSQIRSVRRLLVVAGCSIGLAGCAGGSKTLDALGLDENANARSALSPPRVLLRGTARDGTEFRLRGGQLQVDLARARERLRASIVGKRVRIACGDLQRFRPWPHEAGSRFTFALRVAPGSADPKRLGRDIERCAIFPVPGVEPLTSTRMRPA